MEFKQTDLRGVILVEPQIHEDHRGFFLEFYHAKKFSQGGIQEVFVQDNQSLSFQGTLRGLHAQLNQPQGKLVRVIEGEIYDVAVDVRKSSPTFKQWIGIELSAKNYRQLYIPPGFVHGFCVTSERAQVEYKCTAFYNSSDEFGIIWDDPDLTIDWPVKDPVVSEKDKKLPRLAEIIETIPDYRCD